MDRKRFAYPIWRFTRQLCQVDEIPTVEPAKQVIGFATHSAFPKTKTEAKSLT
jgi:hypothetical protein